MKTKITSTMTELVARLGYQNVTLNMLCKEAGCPAGSFQHVMKQTFTEFQKSFITHENSASVITRSRLSANRRRLHLLDTGLALASAEGGLLNTDLHKVAYAANVSYSTVRHYFGTTEGLRGALIDRAVSNNCTRVLEQARALYPSRDLTTPTV